MEENNILIAIIGLGVGAVIGYFAGRSSTSNSSHQEREVEQLKSEMNSYKESVASHFQHTATMINEMNDSYKGVIHHLAKGSQDLCDAGTAKDVEARLIPGIEAPREEAVAQAPKESETPSIVEPPRDYAPKQPDEVGALSENYGVKTKGQESAHESENISEITPPYDAPKAK